MIAALYVIEGGPYYGLEGVDPWPQSRDARAYPGPHPVVAHPPCARWGRYWHGGPTAKVRRRLGDDGGCFAAALASVRSWGGVLEHPEASHAWRRFGIAAPPRAGGWVPASRHPLLAPDDGWTCCVEQGHYGHRARKATWLYVVGVPRELLPELIWGPSAARVRLDVGLHSGFHSAEERARVTRGRALYNHPRAGMSPDDRACRREFLRWRELQTGLVPCAPERLNARERLETPEAFRELLLGIARSTQRK